MNITIYDEKPQFGSPAPAQPAKKQKKPLTPARCVVYAILWGFFSGGVLFPVSVYYLYKAWKLWKNK